MDDTPLDLSHELTIAQAAARTAGDYLRQRLGSAQPGKTKAARDIQLDVDLGAERLLLTAIHAAFPDDAILSEEAESAPPAEQRLWIVDPLDGSFNFQHGCPQFGVAIALQVGGATQLGVLYLPIADELYTAVRGQGAFCNGAALHASQTTTLGEALVHVSDFAFSGNPDDNRQRLQVMAALASAVGRVRMIGTAVGDWAWLASGKADDVVMYSTHPWDVEAGALLVEEAGGAVTRVVLPDGHAAYVGGNRLLHGELVRLVLAARSAE
jgi:myo-inositol-1(or 4)-monophosphatase